MSYKKLISQLRQGLPQNWIYIERKINNGLDSAKSEGIAAPQQFKGNNLSKVFCTDLLDVYHQEIALLRVIIGPNGIGKSTQLELKIKEHLEQVIKTPYIHLNFDLKHISEDKESFWPTFLSKFYDQLKVNMYLNHIYDMLTHTSKKTELFSFFRDSLLVEMAIKIISTDQTDQDDVEQIIFGNAISQSQIKKFFFGFLQMAFHYNFFVTICFDELQFLNAIEPSKTLAKFFLEQFIRETYETFRDKRLYLLLSCLNNHDKKEYRDFQKISGNFRSITENKEIILGNLTLIEKDQILDQVAMKIGMESEEKRKFLKKIKTRLDYYTPRGLLKSISEILEIMGYASYSQPEMRKIYENEARNYISPILTERGFSQICLGPKDVGGFNFDIYATQKSQRFNRVPRTFGEITITQRSSMKTKVEKYVSWLHQLNGSEYHPEQMDIALFICPPDRITPQTRELLNSNNIQLFEFESSIYSDLQSFDKIIKKDAVFHLQDIPGVGIAKVKLLNQAEISTLQELIHCNVNQASQIKGLGRASLLKWIQKAKQMLE